MMSNQNTVLYGYPGSGKTTCVKSIVNNFLNRENDSYNFDYLLLVRMRNINFKDI